jgi:hypothetical protein
MSRSSLRLPRVLSALTVAGMLGFGARSALARPAQSCPLVSEGMHNLTCSVGPAGNAYCDGECKRIHGEYSVGECFQENCCLCAI